MFIKQELEHIKVTTMRIDNITIENFRGINRLHMDFAPGATILIGKNGAGKTTLVSALHKALSFIFSKDTSVKTDKNLTSGIPSLKVEKFNKKNDGHFNEQTKMTEPSISIQAEASWKDEKILWEMMASTSTYAIQQSKYTKAFRQFYGIYKRTDELPVLAFYSDGFPHVSSNNTKISKTTEKQRNYGYYQWNDEKSCAEVWIDRLERTWKENDRYDRKIKDVDPDDKTSRETLLKEKVLFAKEYESILITLKKFTAKCEDWSVADIYVDVDDEELYLKFDTGQRCKFRLLPAGYKRLLYMVLDIAYRAYRLNGAVEKTEGIVIIDELDLHLHPYLERNVLGWLLDTFPHIQFIITTHSPLVVANADARDGVNAVYLMTSGGQPKKLPNLYGVDYDAALRDFMGTPSRNEKVKELIENYDIYGRIGLEREREETRNALVALVGDEQANEMIGGLHGVH